MSPWWHWAAAKFPETLELGKAKVPWVQHAGDFLQSPDFGKRTWQAGMRTVRLQGSMKGPSTFGWGSRRSIREQSAPLICLHPTPPTILLGRKKLARGLWRCLPQAGPTCLHPPNSSQGQDKDGGQAERAWLWSAVHGWSLTVPSERRRGSLALHEVLPCALKSAGVFQWVRGHRVRHIWTAKWSDFPGSHPAVTESRFEPGQYVCGGGARQLGNNVTRASAAKPRAKQIDLPWPSSEAPSLSSLGLC